MTATAFDTADLEPLAAYKLLIGLIVPRPIAWIGTTSETGVHNLAPFSFFNAVAATPPTLLFSPLGSPGQPKDTLANIRATGQFTHNVVSEDLVEAMNTTAGSYEHGVDEFEIAQLTPIPGWKPRPRWNAAWSRFWSSATGRCPGMWSLARSSDSTSPTGWSPMAVWIPTGWVRSAGWPAWSTPAPQLGSPSSGRPDLVECA